MNTRLQDYMNTRLHEYMNIVVVDNNERVNSEDFSFFRHLIILKALLSDS